MQTNQAINIHFTEIHHVLEINTDPEKPVSFWCSRHKQHRNNLGVFVKKPSIVSLWIRKCGPLKKWVYESCQFALSFWGGEGVVLTFFDFSFWNYFYFRVFFLVDYEIKQVQPRTNHFDQSERQLFWEFSPAKNLKMSHFIPVWTEARFQTLQILCETKFLSFHNSKINFPQGLRYWSAITENTWVDFNSINMVGARPGLWSQSVLREDSQKHQLSRLLALGESQAQASWAPMPRFKARYRHRSKCQHFLAPTEFLSILLNFKKEKYNLV